MKTFSHRPDHHLRYFDVYRITDTMKHTRAPDTRLARFASAHGIGCQLRRNNGCDLSDGFAMSDDINRKISIEDDCLVAFVGGIVVGMV